MRHYFHFWRVFAHFSQSVLQLFFCESFDGCICDTFYNVFSFEGSDELVFNDVSPQNSALYYTFNKSKAEVVHMPAPLYLHLYTFLNEHYRRKINPDPLREYKVNFVPIDMNEAWYSYAKQIQAVSQTQFLHYVTYFDNFSDAILNLRD